MDTVHIHILKVGRHADGNMSYLNADNSLLREIADNYSPLLHEAPIVLGHSSHVDALGTTDSTPSFGWVKRLYTDPQGTNLYAECDLTDECRTLVDNKYYKKRSVSLYDKNSPFNPTPGKIYIKHLAFLGAHPPAIKGLQDIIFSEMAEKEQENPSLDEPTSSDEPKPSDDLDKPTESPMEDQPEKPPDIESLEEDPEGFFKFQIMDGSRGYKGDISSIDPIPSAENNWLYDEQNERFTGRFVDGDTEEEFEFEIVKSGDNWVKTFKPVITEEKGQKKDTEMAENKDKIEDLLEEDLDVEEEDLDVEEEEMEETSSDNSKEKELEEKVKALEKQLKDKNKKEDKAFVDKIYSEARIANSVISAEELLLWYQALPDVSSDLVFSEGKQASVKEFAQKVLESLTPLVELGEMDETSEPVEAEEVNAPEYSAPLGSIPDNSQLLLHNKALEYMEANELDRSDTRQYVKAVKAVMS